MKKLHISDSLSLPIDIATEKLGHLGTTGSGKTYGASKLAELMLDAGVQVVILDYAGIWYGLRLGADGKSPGIQIPVFGGLRGDLPLEPTAGAMIADLIVDRTVSVVLDVSQFEFDTDKARFGAAFADRLFFRKKSSPSALHLFIEEAQEFIPEDTQKGEERMLHAFNRIQKIGRNFGIGTSIITQRPQEVNKKALNLAQTLFVYRTTGPHERKAIASWMQAKGLPQNVANDLPTLPTGVAHVWSPQFLGISEKVKISPKRTFDSSATPKVGAVTKKAKDLAPVDLEKIRTDMAATIERAKDNDPQHLKKQLAEAKREIAQLQKRAPATPAEKVRVVEKPVLKDGQLDRLEKLVKRADEVRLGLSSALAEIGGAIGAVRTSMNATPTVRNSTAPHVTKPTPSFVFHKHQNVGPTTSSMVTVGQGAIRKLLTACAQHPEGLSYRKLGVFSGVSTKGGSFRTFLSTMRGNGWIEGDDAARVRITAAGLAALGPYQELPTGRDLVEYWIAQFGNSKPAEILRVVADAYPRALTHQEIGELANVSTAGGSFRTFLSTLRSRDLIEGSRDIRLAEDLAQ